jgi:hypothetical protein
MVNIGERRIEKRLICGILKLINCDENPVYRESFLLRCL